MNQIASKVKRKPYVTTFLKSCYTKKEALMKLRILRDYLNFIYFKKLNLPFYQSIEEFKKTKQDGFEIDFLVKLGEPFIKQFSVSTINEDIALLDQAISGTKIVNLYVPFSLPEKEQSELGSWFKKNLGEEALYEPLFDPNLIGGCALSFKGIYREYSLRQKIVENREKIIRSLAAYSR